MIGGGDLPPEPRGAAARSRKANDRVAQAGDLPEAVSCERIRVRQKPGGRTAPERCQVCEGMSAGDGGRTVTGSSGRTATAAAPRLTLELRRAAKRHRLERIVSLADQ